MVTKRQWPAALIAPSPPHKNIVVLDDLHEIPKLKSNTFLVLRPLDVLLKEPDSYSTQKQ